MWLVRGYLRYKEKGLEMGKGMREVVKQYEKDNDLVLQFLEARCERRPDCSIRAKDLYAAFKIWAKSESAPVLSARKFNSELDRHPEWYEGKGATGGYPTIRGVKLKEVM